MTRTIFIIPAALLLLNGCTLAIGSRSETIAANRYVNPSISDENTVAQLQADRNECAQETNVISFPDIPEFEAVSTEEEEYLRGVYDQALFTAETETQKIFDSCMVKKGYNKAPAE